jgi:hypothetical protein
MGRITSARQPVDALVDIAASNRRPEQAGQATHRCNECNDATNLSGAAHNDASPIIDITKKFLSAKIANR